jgi:hypothetical protein
VTLTIRDPAVPLDGIRARFRAFGLAERPSGLSWFYAPARGEGRLLLILTAVGNGAQIYLYPQALGRAPGAAQWFYALLEEADFGLGSKLGPSISLPLEDEARMALFWDGFGRLLAEEPPTGATRR